MVNLIVWIKTAFIALCKQKKIVLILNEIEIIYRHKMDLALKDLQWLKCYRTKLNV